MRGRNDQYGHEAPDLVEQCALLVIGISQAQAFADGNKRTAFIAADVFLRANGCFFAGDPLEMARQLEAVAEHAGSLKEATSRFAAWPREQVACQESS